MAKGIDAEIDKVLRIMEANPETSADIAANLLNHARISGDGPLRQKFLRKAQKLIAQIDPHAESEKLQELQAQVLALQGRGGDTEIAHVTPGEVVIPARIRTPEVMAALAPQPGETVETVAEPFLVREGLLARTSRGRVATPAAWEHLGLTAPR